MRVLVIGSGGREHALCWRISKSPVLTELFCVPGNAGTQQVAKAVPELKGASVNALALWAVEQQIDLTVVGPEAPLAEGIVDVFREHGLKIVGPTRAGARLEFSKSFAKDVMLKAGVRTAAGEVFTEYDAAVAYLRKVGAPIVIKADGLAAGKGVVVAETLEEALGALNDFMVEGGLGEAGKSVVIEERLVGREASVIVLADGKTVIPLVVSQDHKRLEDGDRGPNTGGMGAISPTPVLGDKRVEQLVGEVFVPVLSELNARGIAYTGFLYGGVMVDRAGQVHVLEFNCRLGDPETQVIMMRLQSDLLPALLAAAEGRLAAIDLKWSSQPAASVVLASPGYPRSPELGGEIQGLFRGDEQLQVFHAGTKAVGEAGNERICTSGGRVLAVSAMGTTLNNAIERAYQGVSRISFPGMQYRKDIGATSE